MEQTCAEVQARNRRCVEREVKEKASTYVSRQGSKCQHIIIRLDPDVGLGCTYPDLIIIYVSIPPHTGLITYHRRLGLTHRRPSGSRQTTEPAEEKDTTVPCTSANGKKGRQIMHTLDPMVMLQAPMMCNTA